MTTNPPVKLGKLAPKADARLLRLAAYLPLTLPTAPAEAEFWSKAVPTGAWGMMGNDRLGDCTCAAAGHLIQQWTGNSGKYIDPPDAAIIAAYSAITGYDPAKPSTDQGAVELDVLDYWRQTGIAGHKIGAYAAVERARHDHVQAALFLFGGLYLGVALPQSAQTQEEWDVPPGGTVGAGAPGSWGGHAVEACAYDAGGVWVVTWGALKRMTWAFWDAYVDEAYAVLSSDFLNGQGVTPEGFDLGQLQLDLAAVAA